MLMPPRLAGRDYRRPFLSERRAVATRSQLGSYWPAVLTGFAESGADQTESLPLAVLTGFVYCAALERLVFDRRFPRWVMKGLELVLAPVSRWPLD